MFNLQRFMESLLLHDNMHRNHEPEKLQIAN
jgi:hypothetical protein